MTLRTKKYIENDNSVDDMKEALQRLKTILKNTNGLKVIRNG